MMDTLLEIDYAVFEFINYHLSNWVFDSILVWWRNSIFWVPLYVFIIAFFAFNFGSRSYWVAVFALLTVATTDLTSSQLIKKSVQRDRPCRTEELQNVQSKVRCGGGYSFTSSHAANHFAIAVFFIGILGGRIRYVKPALLIWAGIVCFSQVYVGVHFPSDVIGGALLGITIGWVWSWLFNRFYALNFDPAT